MARGRPKKKDNMNPMELYEALVAEREARKHDLHKYLLPRERESIQRLNRAIAPLRDAYNNLMHPFYDDIVAFDNASSEFNDIFGEPNGFDATKTL